MFLIVSVLMATLGVYASSDQITNSESIIKDQLEQLHKMARPKMAVTCVTQEAVNNVKIEDEVRKWAQAVLREIQKSYANPEYVITKPKISSSINEVLVIIGEDNKIRPKVRAFIDKNKHIIATK